MLGPLINSEYRLVTDLIATFPPGKDPLESALEVSRLRRRENAWNHSVYLYREGEIPPQDVITMANIVGDIATILKLPKIRAYAYDDGGVWLSLGVYLRVKTASELEIVSKSLLPVYREIAKDISKDEFLARCGLEKRLLWRLSLAIHVDYIPGFPLDNFQSDAPRFHCRLIVDCRNQENPVEFESVPLDCTRLILLNGTIDRPKILRMARLRGKKYYELVNYHQSTGKYQVRIARENYGGPDTPLNFELEIPDLEMFVDQDGTVPGVELESCYRTVRKRAADRRRWEKSRK